MASKYGISCAFSNENRQERQDQEPWKAAIVVDVVFGRRLPLLTPPKPISCHVPAPATGITYEPCLMTAPPTAQIRSRALVVAAGGFESGLPYQYPLSVCHAMPCQASDRPIFFEFRRWPSKILNGIRLSRVENNRG